VTSQNQKNRRKGSQYELDVLAYVRSLGLPAERLRLSGRFDEGDLVIQDEDLTYICELKNEQKLNLAGWVTEAIVERANYAKKRDINPDDVMPLVVVKRRGRPIADSYVVVPLKEFLAP
jgi:Holliday junction resolvase